MYHGSPCLTLTLQPYISSTCCSWAAFSSMGVWFWGSAFAAHFNYVNNAAKALLSALQQGLFAALAAALWHRRLQRVCSTGGAQLQRISIM